MKIILYLISFILIFSAGIAGELYVANGDVYLRKAPPSPPFYTNKEQIGVVRKGEQVNVLEKKSIFMYSWLKVQLPDRDNKIGWVYNGKKGNEPYFEKLGDQ